MSNEYSINREVVKKWKEVLDESSLPAIKSSHVRSEVAKILENTERELRADPSSRQMRLLGEEPTNVMGQSSSVHGSGAIDTFDPVLISLIRRSMPNLVAFEGLCGVQAMTGPTGLVFAMRSRYSNSSTINANGAQNGPETFYNEVNTGFASFGGMGLTANAQSYPGSGPAGQADGWPNTVTANTVGAAGGNLPAAVYGGTGANTQANNAVPQNPDATGANANIYNYGGAVATQFAETLGNSPSIFPEMAFSIEKVTATAGSRALKAEYSMELVQDLKAIHGLDAEAELSNILSTEILAEINREIVRSIVVTAVPGSQLDTTTPGQFDLDVDSNGRWLQEKFLGMYYQLDREANASAKATRRGKGNVLLCTSDVASALNAAKVLTYNMDKNPDLTVDDTGNTFVGRLNNGMKVFIDPYAVGANYWVVGYRGSNPMDAGVFYCPYVPLQMLRAVDPATFQPKIAFKTRYAMVSNPFSGGLNQNLGQLLPDSNVYYRRTVVLHLQ